MNEKTINKIGWVASMISILMYLSYIDQIRLNISEQKGSIILPIVTAINGTGWFLYAILKTKKDWPIAICNGIGIIFGIVTAITAII